MRFASCRAADGSRFEASTALHRRARRAATSKSSSATPGRALRRTTCHASLKRDSAPEPAVPDSDSPSAIAFLNSTEARSRSRAAPVTAPLSGFAFPAMARRERLERPIRRHIRRDTRPILYPKRLAEYAAEPVAASGARL